MLCVKIRLSTAWLKNSKNICNIGSTLEDCGYSFGNVVYDYFSKFAFMTAM